MSKAPKKIWVESKEEWRPSMMSKKQMYAGQAYIRADLVDGLVEALEDVLSAWEDGYRTSEDQSTYQEAKAALAVLKEEG